MQVIGSFGKNSKMTGGSGDHDNKKCHWSGFRGKGEGEELETDCYSRLEELCCREQSTGWCLLG